MICLHPIFCLVRIVTEFTYNDENMSTDTHLKLLSAVALGDRQAFEKLYQATSGQLYAVSLQLLQQQQLAEDALQDAFVSIWHKAADYRQDRGTVLTWMVSIVRYRALDLIRSKKVRKEQRWLDESGELMEADDPSPHFNFMQSRDRAKIDDCLDELDQTQADAISLAFFRGYTHREVGRHMASPLGSVKSWIRRGLQGLRRCLGI